MIFRSHLHNKNKECSPPHAKKIKLLNFAPQPTKTGKIDSAPQPAKKKKTLAFAPTPTKKETNRAPINKEGKQTRFCAPNYQEGKIPKILRCKKQQQNRATPTMKTKTDFAPPPCKFVETKLNDAPQLIPKKINLIWRTHP